MEKPINSAVLRLIARVRDPSNTCGSFLGFAPFNIFAMMAANVDGQAIAEYKQAPFALDRHYGLKTDRWETQDPEGVYVRVQNKGLPVLYQRDALYILDVE